MTTKLAFALPLLFLTPLVTYSYPQQSVPFQIRIVDGAGHGIPHVRVIAENHIVCYTDAKGLVRWNEAELMDKNVRFSIDRDGYTFPGGGTTLQVTHSGHADLTMELDSPGK